MSDYEDTQALINSIDGLDEEKKTSLLGLLKNMNTESAKKGLDLIKVKSELDKSSQNEGAYKKFVDALAKQGVKAEEADKLAEKVGILKTHDDDMNTLKQILKESQAKEKESTDRLNGILLDASLGPKFEEAVKDFKDKEGNAVNFLPITLERARAGIEGITTQTDEAVINDKIYKALQTAQVNQETFMKENGLTVANSTTHKVGEVNQTGSGSGAVLQGNDIRQVMLDNGQDTNSAAMAIAAARNAQQQ